MGIRTASVSWMRSTLPSYGLLFLIAALCVLSSCNSSEPASSRAQVDPQTQGRAHSACDLLTEDEIQRAIGPHIAGQPNISEMTGKSVVNSMWGFQSCRWTATTAQQMQGFPNGWIDKIELKVFDKERLAAAQKQAEGEPLKALGEGSRYDATNGRLWFNCGDGQFCMLSADTANGEKREQLVSDLATRVQGRLK